MDESPEDERALIADALGIDAAAAHPISREPLGRGSVSGYRIDGDISAIVYLDTSLLPVAEETGLALPGVARLWTHPADPHLPALAPAAFGHGVQILLARLGITAQGAPEMVGYRPGRRAVLRVPTDRDPAWIKIVRPRRIERVVRVHADLRAGGLPVPPVRGWSPDGLLVLDQAEGVAATEAEWDPDALLDAVEDLRSRIAVVEVQNDARASLRGRLPWYRDRLARDLPGSTDLVQQVAHAGGEAIDDGRTRTVIHGDLHLGQLFLGPEHQVTGLVDVDTAGVGDPADDSAAFIAHAVTSSLLTENPDAEARVRLLATQAWRRWGQDRHTRALIAVHLLGHAVGAAARGAEDDASVLVELAARAVMPEPAKHKSRLTNDFELP